MASSQRVQKVNEVVKRELGSIILKEIDFPKNILVTLTEVETSKDLRGSIVFIQVFPEKETINILRILKKEIYELQQILNRRLVMRPIPKIKFVREEELGEAQRIEKILDKIKNDNEQERIENSVKIGFNRTREWPGTQAVRERSAKPFYAGASPAQASKIVYSQNHLDDFGTTHH